MTSRLSFLNTFFVCAITCTVFAASGFAETSVRWKTPNVGGAKSSAPSLVNTAAFTEVKVPSAKTGPSPIQQVRYLDQERGTTPLPDGSVPSRAAEVDMNYSETRPQVPSSQRQSASNLPTPNSSVFGSNTDFSGTDIVAEDIPRVTDPDELRPGNVVIKCPEGGIFKPLTEIGYEIPQAENGYLPKECQLGDEVHQPRDWQQVCFLWKASALCHKPLYFEEEALERYGHTHVREELQPLVSGAKFFLTIPILPYKMGINPPRECIYTLGHYRPGDCAPYMLDPLPISLRAGLIEAGVIVGGVAIFP